MYSTYAMKSIKFHEKLNFSQTETEHQNEHESQFFA